VRPQVLYPLFSPLTALPGIGPRYAKLFEKSYGSHVLSLLWQTPTGIVDRRDGPPLLSVGETPGIVTILLQVVSHHPGRTLRQPYRIRCSDGTAFIDLVFFKAKPDYLQKILPVGETKAISGRVERFGGALNMIHPDYILPKDKIDTLRRLEPVYPLTAGLTQKIVHKAINLAINRLPDLSEWIDRHLLTSESWPSWRQALLSAHHPTQATDILATSPARQRLAYDELLASQLALVLARKHARKLAGRSNTGDGHLRHKVMNALPYHLTRSQVAAIADIERDMAAPLRMLRMLQGDVGSGKTIVALLAMTIAVEAGGQAAFLAPTDILARQHYATLQKFAGAADISVALLTGREKGKTRQEIQTRLANGALSIVIGTHALIQDDVSFKDLRLVVVDEQHRFGVEQRMILAEKGESVDFLIMTATPIPRTMQLAAYGDIDVSLLIDKPANRQSIDTRTIALDRIDDVISGLKRAIKDGARIYWVCPLIEESELADAAAATERFRTLAETFGNRIGIVHGKQKADERDKTMSAFAEGEIDILVATTVIEVGVDIPEATIMVIEHAERFGLAQLHQLRGRVGRGVKKSSCILLYQTPLSEVAKKRLSIIKETDDGFRIAEEDLRLRGSGEILGTKQSGLPGFHFVDISVHKRLLDVANRDAKKIAEEDETLESVRGYALRTLLYLFEKDVVFKTVRAG